MNKPYDLVITVLDTATVFEATEDAFRYDLTSAGVTEGWALDKIVEQAKQLLPQWPAVTIQIIAEATVKEILAEQLSEHGVSVEAASTREASYTKREPIKAITLSTRVNLNRTSKSTMRGEKLFGRKLYPLATYH